MAGFFVPNSVLAPDLAEYFASFQQIVSYLFDPDKFFETNLRRAGVKNYLPAYVKIDDSLHAAQQLARPLERLALFLEDHGARLFPTEEDDAFARDFLTEDVRPIVAIHPGSGSPRKNWAVENWATLGTSILKHESHPRLLLVGGEADSLPLGTLAGVWRGADV